MATELNAPGKVSIPLILDILSFFLQVSGCIKGGWESSTARSAFKVIKYSPTLSTTYLRDADGEGWNQALRVNSYYVTINDEAVAAIVRNLEKYMPNHQPIWTCVGVPRLDEDDMRVEIEVVASVLN